MCTCCVYVCVLCVCVLCVYVCYVCMFVVCICVLCVFVHTCDVFAGSSAERLKGMKPGGSPLRGGTSLLLSGEQKEPLERRPTPERRPRTPLTASCMSVAGVEETAPLTPSEEEEKIPKDVTERSSLISAEQAEVGRVRGEKTEG